MSILQRRILKLKFCSCCQPANLAILGCQWQLDNYAFTFTIQCHVCRYSSCRFVVDCRIFLFWMIFCLGETISAHQQHNFRNKCWKLPRIKIVWLYSVQICIFTLAQMSSQYHCIDIKVPYTATALKNCFKDCDIKQPNNLQRGSHFVQYNSLKLRTY